MLSCKFLLRSLLITATLPLYKNTSAVNWHSPVIDCPCTVFMNQGLRKVPSCHLGQVGLRMFTLTVSAHPYCTCKFTCHIMHERMC